jgi:hypothetical protein
VFAFSDCDKDLQLIKRHAALLQAGEMVLLSSLELWPSMLFAHSFRFT